MGLLERLLPMRRPPLWMEPPAVLPGLVGEVLVLAHTDAAAVAITGLGGYPTGFSFRLRVLLRREKPVSHGFDLPWRCIAGVGGAVHPRRSFCVWVCSSPTEA
jgi:hypothetical protein